MQILLYGDEDFTDDLNRDVLLYLSALSTKLAGLIMN